MSKNKFSYWNNILIVVLFYAGITGIITGLILYLFRWLVSLLFEYSIMIYEYVSLNLWFIPLLLLGLALIAYLVSLLNKFEPTSAGGGIARSIGVVRGLLTFRWLRTLISTFFAALFGTFAGLPLGIEGPSVLMGTATARGVYELGRAHPSNKKYILSAGTSAGFAVATGSIMAGTLFTLEEVHKKFSLMLLSVSMSGAVFAALTVRFIDYLLDTSYLFFPIGNGLLTIDFEHIWLAPILGIGAGLLAYLYNFMMDYLGHLSVIKLKHIPLFIKYLINFTLVGLIGLLMIESLGSGHEQVVLPLLSREYSFLVIGVLLLIKLFTIPLSAAAGPTGGMFVPTLVVGALYAGVFNEVAILFGLSPTYTTAIIMIGIAAFLGTSMQMPITVVAFIVETSLHPETIIFMMIAVFAGILTAEALHTKPLNEITLKRFMKVADRDRIWHLYQVQGKILPDAFVVGKTVRDVLWPSNTLIKELVQDDSHYRSI